MHRQIVRSQRVSVFARCDVQERDASRFGGVRRPVRRPSGRSSRESILDAETRQARVRRGFREPTQNTTRGLFVKTLASHGTKMLVESSRRREHRLDRRVHVTITSSRFRVGRAVARAQGRKHGRRGLGVRHEPAGSEISVSKGKSPGTTVHGSHASMDSSSHPERAGRAGATHADDHRLAVPTRSGETGTVRRFDTVDHRTRGDV